VLNRRQVPHKERVPRQPRVLRPSALAGGLSQVESPLVARLSQEVRRLQGSPP
jgi:hypothetical protein